MPAPRIPESLPPDLHIRYLEPAIGDVVAQAKVVRLSARGAVLECSLYSRGQVAAISTAHYTIKKGLSG